MASATEQKTHVRDRIYLGGEWTASSGTGVLEVINSSTEEVMGSIPDGTAEDVDRAVSAARAAFESWSQTSVQERADWIGAIAAALGERGEEIAVLIAQEVGMPVKLAGMIQAGLPTMDFGSLPALMAEMEWEQELGNSLIIREPVGVVGAITPWNYPLHQVAAKVAAALAAGCTIIVKPSEVAPLSAFVLADIIDELGLPAGVFNLVTGVGGVVGEAMSSHPGIDMISFTGSTAAGKKVSAAAAGTVKRVALELGGKSANVILDDADLQAAVTDGVAKCFLNSGQTCSALTRMLVPRERLAEAEQIAAVVAAHFTTGDPFDPETKLGPLVSETQRKRVRGYIERGSRRARGSWPGVPRRPRALSAGTSCSPPSSRMSAPT